MPILIVAATSFEIAPLIQYLTQNWKKENDDQFSKNDLVIQLLVTGVGQSLTTYHLTKILQKEQFQLIINAGIAGAINTDLTIGDVLHVISDRFADLGVEEADGSFTDVHEMKLIEANIPPFENGQLINSNASQSSFLPTADGITINKVHGTMASIAAIKSKYKADVESMESAAFFQVCLLEQVPFLAIRSISNYVEPRNKDNWNLPLSIENLNKVLIDLIEEMSQ